MPGPATLSKSISGFHPRSVPGCQLWLDAADSTSVTTSSSTVIAWRDKSGNANNTTTISGSPTYSANFISLNGSSTYLVGPYVNTTQTMTMFVIATANFSVGYGNYGRLLSVGSTAANDYNNAAYASILHNPNTIQIGGYRNIVTNYGSVTTNTVFVIALVYDSTNSTTYINGSSVSTVASTGTFNTSSYSIGRDVGNTDGTGPTYSYSYWPGTVGEVIIYNAALTTVQRQQVEGYLSWKWNIQTSISSFNPTYISGCMLWLDSADITTMYQNLAGTTAVTAATQSVSLWKDKSGNAYNATANGTPATYANYGITFAGAQNYSTSLSSTMLTQSGFAVISYTGSAKMDIISVNSTSGTAGLQQIINAGSQIITSYGGATVVTGAAVTASTIVLYNYTFNSGVNAFIYLNGTQTGTSTGVTISGTGTISIGSYNNSGSLEPFTGVIYEIILYNSVLSTIARQMVETYLSRKWGISVSTTVTNTHPYTLIKPFTRQFSPLDVPGCALWLDGLDQSTLNSGTITNGGTVTTWLDKSGNGYTCTVAVNCNAVGPVYNSTTNALQFVAGNSNALATPQAFGTSLISATFTFVIVGQRTASTGYSYFLSGQATLANQNIMIGFSNNYMEISGYGPVLDTAITAYSSPDPIRIYGYDVNSTNYDNVLNGSLLSAGITGGTSLLTAFTIPEIGRRYGNTGAVTYHSFNLFEMIAFTPALTTAQRQQVEGYLASKWKISLASATHPFYSFPPSSSSIFSPTSFTGCQLWLDASDPAGTGIKAASGASISTWVDKSKMGNNAIAYTQYMVGATVTAATNPTIVSPSQNGLPGLLFSGTSGMYCPAFLNTSSGSVFMVVNFSGSSGQPFIVWKLKYSSYFAIKPGQLYIGLNSSGTYPASGYDAQTSYTNNYGSPYVLGMTLSASSAASSSFTFVGSVNGAPTTTTGTSTSGNPASCSDYVSIGIDSESGVAYYPMFGTIYEVIIYNNALTSLRRQQIEGYLSQKWGISLPSTHPYYRILPSQISEVITVPSILISLTSTTITATWTASQDAISYVIALYSSTSGVVGTYTTLISKTTITGSLTTTFTGISTPNYYQAYIYVIGSFGQSSVVTSNYIYIAPPFEFTFTNAGVTGRTGPSASQCNTAYAGVVTITMTTNGYQLWTVPTTQTYTVICAGAAGTVVNGYGNGIIIATTISLTASQTIQFLVGQMGSEYGLGSGGGGGGSFMASGSTPATGVCLVAAGGGGGCALASATYSASDAINSTTGQSGYGSIAGGTGGNGGTGAIWGGGGGGFTGSGTNSTYIVGSGGASFINGGLGGTSATGGANGGFGGGGGTHGNTGGGAGGGGYSGGGGDSSGGSTVGGGGGGGSYPSGSTTLGLNPGQGYIRILGYTYSSAAVAGTVSISTASTSGATIIVGTGTYVLMYKYYLTTSASSIVSPVYSSNSLTPGTFSFSVALTGGTTYYAAVVAINTFGTSSTVFSSAYVLVGIVATVTLSGLTSTGGTITWSSATSATGYNWYVGTGQGTGVIASGSTASTSTSFSATLSNGYYTAWVAAYNSSGVGNTTYSSATYYSNATGTLYSFSSFTFTNAGATGNTGPTLAQCQSAYAGNSWATGGTYLTMTTQGYQLWTAPTSGTYTIVCAGASLPFRMNNYGGGYGVIIATTVNLIVGQQIQLLVGQQPTYVQQTVALPGAGGSFVATGLTPASGGCIIAAGGGGGSSDRYEAATATSVLILNGSTTTGGNSNGSYSQVGGTSGSGGTVGTAINTQAGAGFIGNASITTGMGSTPLSFINGGTGGGPTSVGYPVGGFGGGGGVYSVSNSGSASGGGGGYSGGAGGYSGGNNQGGGGGGSFPSGALSLGLNYTAGNGYITIYSTTYTLVPTSASISIVFLHSTMISVNITASASYALGYIIYITTSASSIAAPVYTLRVSSAGTYYLYTTMGTNYFTISSGVTYYAAVVPINTVGSGPTSFSSGRSITSITTISYSGATTTYTVPSGITSLNVNVNGASGGGGGYGWGGCGARVYGTLTVFPTQVLTILVGGGGNGQSGTNSTVYAFGGGGIATVGGSYAGNGGGRSAIQYPAGTDVVDAGGGGGGTGGAGSYPGVGGYVGTNSGDGVSGTGYGGTQTTGGASYTGGNGQTTNGGGGGGGYFGGLGGGGPGGGGGSSLTSNLANPVVISGAGSTRPGYYAIGGNGSIIICY